MVPKDQIQFVQKDKAIEVWAGEQLIASYLYSDTLTKPVLYPLNTLSGIQITRCFPMEDCGDETTDHPHHMGLYFTSDEVNESGFWNNKTYPPQIVLKKLLKAENNQIESIHIWMDKRNEPLLKENRKMTFAILSNAVQIDFDIQLSPIDTVVTFHDTKEGMFAIRLADWLREKGGTGLYHNAEGDSLEKNIWGRRSPYVWIEGKYDNQAIGVGIFHHQSSVNYPTFSMARGYGLFSANPLGQYVYQSTLKEPNASHYNLTLDPQEKANFRFRVVIYEGHRDATYFKKIDESFQNLKFNKD